MNQAVVVKYRWTVDELLEAHCYHSRHICRPVFWFALYLIGGLIVVAGIAALATDLADSFLFSTAALFIGVCYFFARPYMWRWWRGRQFAKRPDRDIQIEWEISPDKICATTDLGHSEVSWQTFLKYLVTPNGILLYPNEQIFHWLPRHGFASDADFQTVVEFAQSKIERRYQVA